MGKRDKYKDGVSVRVSFSPPELIRNQTLSGISHLAVTCSGGGFGPALIN